MANLDIRSKHSFFRIYTKALVLALSSFIFSSCINTINDTTAQRYFYIRGIITNGSPLNLSIIEFDNPSNFDFRGTTENYNIPGWGSRISSGFVKIHDIQNDTTYRNDYPFKSQVICSNLIGKSGSSYLVTIKLDSFNANYLVQIPDSFEASNWLVKIKNNNKKSDVVINCQYPKSYGRDSVFFYHSQNIVKSNYAATYNYQIDNYLPFHLISQSDSLSYNLIKPDFFQNWYPTLEIFQSAKLHFYVFPKSDIANALRIDETLIGNKNPFSIPSNPKTKISNEIFGTIVGTYHKSINVILE